MNIDTLKTANGSFRDAKVSDILRMLRAGHVTHIQTSRGTIAIRPGLRAVDSNRENAIRGWTVDRAVADAEFTDNSQTKFFAWSERRRLIKAALLFLNGKLHSFDAGDDVIVEANQAKRDAYVLAVQGDRVLVEYEMPAGTTALVFYQAVGDQLFRLKSVSHKALAQHWINRIHEQGTAHLWIGNGQRMIQPMSLPGRRLVMQN